MPGQQMLDELNGLDQDFLDLAVCVGDTVAAVVHALCESDSDELALVAGERDALDTLNNRITERGRRILLLHQPVAVDYRQVTAILRMTTALEQIGHLALALGDPWRNLAAMPFALPDDLPQLAIEAAGLLQLALDAYTCRAPALARQVCGTGAEVLDCGATLTGWLTGAMKADPAAVEPGLSLFTVVRGLQRIAGHAIDLAGEVVFLTEDQSVHSHAGTIRLSMS